MSFHNQIQDPRSLARQSRLSAHSVGLLSRPMSAIESMDLHLVYVLALSSRVQSLCSNVRVFNFDLLVEREVPFKSCFCRNKDGRLWASVLAGPQGFLQSPEPSTLAATPLTRLPGDPAELNVGEHIGTLAIKLETRQRERVNGIVKANKGGTLSIDVEQSFSGCPKYIQGIPM